MPVTVPMAVAVTPTEAAGAVTSGTMEMFQAPCVACNIVSTIVVVWEVCWVGASATPKVTSARNALECLRGHARGCWLTTQQSRAIPAFISTTPVLLSSPAGLTTIPALESALPQEDSGYRRSLLVRPTRS
jgi:hypothetical protein